jgi:ATP-dependent DNA helicase RecG
MDLDTLHRILEQGETLEVEFKSDRQRALSDNAIYEEIVALANSNGGVLLVGVEDNGSITGCRPRHNTTTDPLKVQSAIFHNTVPNINTRVNLIPHAQGQVLTIEVDLYPEPCSTASGKSLRRGIGPDGKPQSLPFYARDQRSRRVDLGLLDFSAQHIEGVTFEDLDVLEFARLRQAIKRLHGDQSLLTLADDELAKALKLVKTEKGRLHPNIAGLLLLGKQDVIETHLPTHEVRFQAIGSKGEIKVNDVFRGPLISILDELESRFRVRNEEQEVSVGLVRLPIPDYSLEGFREALNNAVLHRDYSRLGSVYVQWHSDTILITNPGGFPEGVTLDNLLVHEPKPRNPRIADAFKRVGFIEQTGRGVDKIYLGQLRYGRPIPDYSRSDIEAVRVVLPGGNASLAFSAFVYEQDKQQTPLSLDELLVLNTLFLERRTDSVSVGKLTQKGTSNGRMLLEGLHDRGLVNGKGDGRGRVYHLSAGLYRRMNEPGGYVRAHGIDKLRHEAMILEYVTAHSQITRSDVMKLLDLTERQAGHLLKKMLDTKKLVRKGSPPRWTYYVLAKAK